MNPDLLSHRRRLLLLSALGSACGSVGAQSMVTIEGMPFHRTAQVGGVDLLLNGTGLRAVAWFKAYAAALYLTARASTAEQVVKTPGPKRLQLRTYRNLPATEFAKALNVGLPRNSESTAAALLERQERLSAWITALDTVHEGDVIDLDYDPASGLLFRVNGKLRGEPIAGEDFYAALLRVFIGDHPSDNKLKAGLLGLTL